MLIFVTPMLLPSCKIITDLAERYASSVTGTNNPYRGMHDIARNRLARTVYSSEAEVGQFFEKLADFNADVIKPQYSEDDDEEIAKLDEERDKDIPEFKVYNDPTTFTGYYRRLEDISRYYLEKYFDNICYSINYNNDGYRKWEYNNRVQPTLMSTSDDGDAYDELAELLMEQTEDEYSEDARMEAESKLPYLLKRLNSLSALTRCHIVSAIAAYGIAKRENDLHRAHNNSQKMLKPQDLLRTGKLCRCDERGKVTKKLPTDYRIGNEDSIRRVFTWLCGQSTEFAAFTEDYKGFVRCCEILNIELEKDDLSKYDADYCNQLIVTTVTPNDQYDKNIFLALSRNSTTLQPEDDSDPYINSTELFRDALTYSPFLQGCLMEYDKKSQATLQRELVTFENAYIALLKSLRIPQALPYEIGETDNISFSTGFACINNRPVLFRSDVLTNEYSGQYCALSSMGLLVLLSKRSDLKVLPILEALNNIRRKLNKTGDELDTWREV